MIFELSKAFLLNIFSFNFDQKHYIHVKMDLTNIDYNEHFLYNKRQVLALPSCIKFPTPSWHIEAYLIKKNSNIRA